MPTYEYECRSCGHLFEEIQSITAPPKKKCPKCNGPVERLISGGGGIIFKGSGFYTTDYRSEAYKKKVKEESSSSEGQKKKETKKSLPPKTKTAPKSSEKDSKS